jgi:hypothetical protein
MFELETEIQPKNKLIYRSKGPSLIGQLERHLHRRCTQSSEPQLSYLRSGRPLEAESVETDYATIVKRPYFFTNWNATYTEGAHNPLRPSYNVCAPAAHWNPRYNRKTNYATRARGPYLLSNWNVTYADDAHKHSAPQLSCLGTGRLLEA